MDTLNPRYHLTILIGVLLATFTGAEGGSIANLNAFAGKWKEDLSKTVRTLDGAIRKYEQNPDGTMTVTIGETYRDRFRIDGKPHPVIPQPGLLQTWTQTGPSSWESVNTKNGQTVYTIRRTISPTAGL